MGSAKAGGRKGRKERKNRMKKVRLATSHAASMQQHAQAIAALLASVPAHSRLCLASQLRGIKKAKVKAK